jgi:hypothetical protein
LSSISGKNFTTHFLIFYFLSVIEQWRQEMILYVGDIHGSAAAIAAVDEAAVKAGADWVIQVGDFGIFWPGRDCSVAKYFRKRARQGRAGPTWLTCGGNHDNWRKLFELAAEQGEPDLVELAPGCFYVQRGCVHDVDGVKHIFLGGAESVDKHTRVEGESWWTEETPSYGEFSNFSANLEDEKPEVVVTHEAPSRIPIYKTNRDASPTPRNLENILRMSTHTPARWYFGHHHVKGSWTIDDVEFHCCGLDGEYVK